MRAGTLRERITIQALVPSTDGAWGAVEEWQDALVSIAASVIAKSADETEKDKAVQGTTKYTIETRYFSNISSLNRIAWRGKTLDIISAIDPDGRRRSLDIEAAERQAVA